MKNNIMKRILISTNNLRETRLAVLENDCLYNLEIENKKNIQKKGNIYKGIITKVEPSLNAVFVNYGAEKDGFLPFKEIIKEYDFIISLDKVQSNKGKEIIVQIDKDERKNKSASLTTYITLAGFYLVLMPSSCNLEGISRHIDGDMRSLIKEIISNINIPNEIGIIIRTAGIGKSIEELKWELNVLMAQYNTIKHSWGNIPAPCLIHEESNLITRSIRDYLRSDVKEILVDNIKVFNHIYKYLSCVSSDFLDKIKLYRDSVPLFSRFKVEQQIEMSYNREIFLPSGGSIIIDPTEALIAIDVNSAKSNRCLDIKETALQTNLEAIDEIAKQMRLRDLGGLIVVDFIDMPDSFSHKMMEKKLKEIIALDKAKIQISKISKFGLLEMSRQRIKSSMLEFGHSICDICNGVGRIKNIELIINKIISALEEEANDAIQLNLELSSKLMTYLINNKKQSLLQIEKINNLLLNIIPNDQLSIIDYKIFKVKQGEKKINLQNNHDIHISKIIKNIIKNSYK